MRSKAKQIYVKQRNAMNSNTPLARNHSSNATRSEHKWIWGPLGVFKLELIRTLTFGRIMTWLVMALFPPTLIGIASLQIGSRSSMGAAQMNLGYVVMLFFLIPQIVTVLGLLLWATPIVHAELEAQTWGYYVVRPGARRAVLLGKYAIAVLWAFSSATVAVTFAVPFATLTNPLHTWGVLCFLNLISALAYGALFAALGTLIQKRAMVSAFMYGIIVEGILSTLPAAINQFTVSFRLRSILQHMLEMDLKVAPNMARFFDTSTSISFHLVCLGLFASVLMCISLWRVEASQFAWQSEV